MVRAFDPWPRAYTFLSGRRLQVLRAIALPGKSRLPPGTILPESRKFLVATGEGVLSLEEVQLEGRRPLPAGEFLRGQRSAAGSRLG